MLIDQKPWYQSKIVWAGVFMTILGIAQYFADPSHTPVLTVASIAAAVIGIVTVVLRVWFTTQTVSNRAANIVRLKRAREMVNPDPLAPQE